MSTNRVSLFLLKASGGSYNNFLEEVSSHIYATLGNDPDTSLDFSLNELGHTLFTEHFSKEVSGALFDGKNISNLLIGKEFTHNKTISGVPVYSNGASQPEADLLNFVVFEANNQLMRESDKLIYGELSHYNGVYSYTRLSDSVIEVTALPLQVNDTLIIGENTYTVLSVAGDEYTIDGAVSASGSFSLSRIIINLYTKSGGSATTYSGSISPDNVWFNELKELYALDAQSEDRFFRVAISQVGASSIQDSNLDGIPDFANSLKLGVDEVSATEVVAHLNDPSIHLAISDILNDTSVSTSSGYSSQKINEELSAITDLIDSVSTSTELVNSLLINDASIRSDRVYSSQKVEDLVENTNNTNMSMTQAMVDANALEILNHENNTDVHFTLGEVIDDNASASITTYSSDKINTLISSAGGGDMLKSEYDSNGDFKVDSADRADSLNDGTYSITAQDTREHVDNTDVHFTADTVGDMKATDYDTNGDFKVDSADQADEASSLSDGVHSITAQETREHVDSTDNPHNIQAPQVGELDNAIESNSIVSANYSISHSHVNMTLLDNIVNTGLGDSFLADDGTYKEIKESVNLSNSLFVDGSGSDTEGKGTIDLPYMTIQKALDTVGNPVDALDGDRPINIFIAPGFYDEDLTLPGGRLLNLCALGTVVLGDSMSPSVTRNITMVIDSTKELGTIRPTIGIYNLSSLEPTSTHIGRSRGFILSGDFIRTCPIGSDVSSHDVAFVGVRLEGSYTTVDGGQILGQNSLYLEKCYIGGTIDESSPSSGGVYIQRAIRCEFDGIVNVNKIGLVKSSEFDGNITVVSSPSGDLPPSGFFGCDFGGVVFTGPAGSLKVDSSCNSLPSLSGGATLDLIDSSTYMKYDNSVSALASDTVKEAIDEIVTITEGLGDMKATDFATNGSGTRVDASEALKDGTYSITAQETREHVDNTDVHFTLGEVIDDNASASITTYSSDKINTLISSAGGGDMLKSEYDTNDNGSVDKADSLDDGSGNVVTAGQAKSHLDDSTVHFTADTVGDMKATDYDTNGDFKVDSADQADSLNDGTYSITAQDTREHVDSTDNPHNIQASQVGGLDTEISSNADVSANTADRHTHSNKTLLDNITDTGDGSQYLANDGTYKTVSGGSAYNSLPIVNINTFTSLTSLASPDTHKMYFVEELSEMFMFTSSVEGSYTPENFTSTYIEATVTERSTSEMLIKLHDGFTGTFPTNDTGVVIKDSVGTVVAEIDYTVADEGTVPYEDSRFNPANNANGYNVVPDMSSYDASESYELEVYFYTAGSPAIDGAFISPVGLTEVLTPKPITFANKLADETYSITTSQVGSHLENNEIHFTIDDTDSTATDKVYSASKVESLLGSAGGSEVVSVNTYTSLLNITPKDPNLIYNVFDESKNYMFVSESTAFAPVSSNDIFFVGVDERTDSVMNVKVNASANWESATASVFEHSTNTLVYYVGTDYNGVPGNHINDPEGADYASLIDGYGEQSYDPSKTYRIEIWITGLGTEILTVPGPSAELVPKEITPRSYAESLNDGTYSITAQDTREHVDDTSIHFTLGEAINDTTPSDNSLYSSNKIESLVSSGGGGSTGISIVNVTRKDDLYELDPKPVNTIFYAEDTTENYMFMDRAEGEVGPIGPTSLFQLECFYRNSTEMKLRVTYEENMYSTTTLEISEAESGLVVYTEIADYQDHSISHYQNPNGSDFADDMSSFDANTSYKVSVAIDGTGTTEYIIVSALSGILPVPISKTGDMIANKYDSDGDFVVNAADYSNASGHASSLSDGVHSITAQDTRDHVDDDTIHHTIADINSNVQGYLIRDSLSISNTFGYSSEKIRKVSSIDFSLGMNKVIEVDTYSLLSSRDIYRKNAIYNVLDEDKNYMFTDISGSETYTPVPPSSPHELEIVDRDTSSMMVRMNITNTLDSCHVIVHEMDEEGNARVVASHRYTDDSDVPGESGYDVGGFDYALIIADYGVSTYNPYVPYRVQVTVEGGTNPGTQYVLAPPCVPVSTVIKEITHVAAEEIEGLLPDTAGQKFYIDGDREDTYEADGSYLRPYKSFASFFADNPSSMISVTVFVSGNFTENITIPSTHNGISFIGLGDPHIQGKMLINSCHITLKNLSITHSVSGEFTVSTQADSLGRLEIINCNIHHLGTGVECALNYTPDVSELLMLVIYSSSIDGANLTGVSSPMLVSRIHQSVFGKLLVVNNAQASYDIGSCYLMEGIQHNHGSLFIHDCSYVNGVTSTADNSGSNKLAIISSNLNDPVLGMTGLINKTGNCDYAIDRLVRDEANDVLTGTRVWTYLSDDLGNGSDVSGDSVTNALDNLKAKTDIIDDTGDGSQYLANDGTYKTVSGGAGDMLKSEYDTGDNGIVDKAESLDDGTNVVTADQARAHIDTDTGNPHDVKATEITDFDTEVENNTKVALIDDTGDGSQYLANDGTYKTISGGTGTSSARRVILSAASMNSRTAEELPTNWDLISIVDNGTTGYSDITFSVPSDTIVQLIGVMGQSYQPGPAPPAVNIYTNKDIFDIEVECDILANTVTLKFVAKTIVGDSDKMLIAFMEV